MRARLILSQSIVFTSRLSLCVHTYLSNHKLFLPKQQTAHLTVFRFCIMAGVFGDYSQLFRLFHVINFVGVRFVSISSFASVIKRFVRRENPERELQLKKKKFSDTSGEEDSMFVAETENLLDLFPELRKEDTEVFKTSIHDFSVNCGIPIAAILVSKQENCRMCKKPLLLRDNKV